MHLEFQILVL